MRVSVSQGAQLCISARFARRRWKQHHILGVEDLKNIVGKSTAKRLLINKSVPDFDLETIFRDLAMLDYDCAIELAKGFQAEGPRAIATIAIARAILHPKKGASQKR